MAASLGGFTGSFAPSLPSTTADFSLTRSKTGDSAARQLLELDSDDVENRQIKNDWKYITDIESVNEKNQEAGLKSRRLGVTWNDLSVKGAGADVVYV